MKDIYPLIANGELPGFFENNLDGRYQNKNDLVAFLVERKGMGALEAISRQMAIDISTEVSRAIENKLQEILGSDAGYVDPYGVIEFLD